MKRPKPIVFVLLLVLAAGVANAQVNSQNTSQTSSSSTESGKFRFYETKQARGEETYQINRSPNGELNVQAKTDMPFAGQDNKPLVNATLRTTKDFTPKSFSIKGPTLLEIEEDTSITVQVKAGLTPLEAIQAATIVPARVMKLDNEVGTIENGKRADLIILDANPLDNISNVRKIRFVVTQGRLFDCGKLWESVDFKP